MYPTANLGNPYIHPAPRVFIPNSMPKKGTCDLLAGGELRTSELLVTFSLSGLATPEWFSGQEVRSSHSTDGSMTIAESVIILAAPGFFCRRRWFGGRGRELGAKQKYSRYDPTRRQQWGRRMQGSFYLSSNLRLSTRRMILDETQKKWGRWEWALRFALPTGLTG